MEIQKLSERLYKITIWIVLAQAESTHICHIISLNLLCLYLLQIYSHVQYLNNASFSKTGMNQVVICLSTYIDLGRMRRSITVYLVLILWTMVLAQTLWLKMIDVWPSRPVARDQLTAKMRLWELSAGEIKVHASLYN